MNEFAINLDPALVHLLVDDPRFPLGEPEPLRGDIDAVLRVHVLVAVVGEPFQVVVVVLRPTAVFVRLAHHQHVPMPIHVLFHRQFQRGYECVEPERERLHAGDGHSVVPPLGRQFRVAHRDHVELPHRLLEASVVGNENHRGIAGQFHKLGIERVKLFFRKAARRLRLLVHDHFQGQAERKRAHVGGVFPRADFLQVGPAGGFEVGDNVSH